MALKLTAISAGHGLSSRVKGKVDSGAVSKAGQEAIKNLGMATRVYNDMRKLGMPALLIDDVHYSEADDVAANKKAGLFMELHFDAGPPSAQGCSVLIGKGQSLRTKRTAGLICRDLAKQLSTTNRGVHLRTDLAVCRKHTGMDSLLVEIQFITNLVEMKEFERETDAVELILLNRIRSHHGLKPVLLLPK